MFPALSAGDLRGPPEPHPIWQSTPHLEQMNTTQASTKAEIITAAMEITDNQQAKIDQLQQQQVILIGLIAVLTIANLLG